MWCATRYKVQKSLDRSIWTLNIVQLPYRGGAQNWSLLSSFRVCLESYFYIGICKTLNISDLQRSPQSKRHFLLPHLIILGPLECWRLPDAGAQHPLWIYRFPAWAWLLPDSHHWAVFSDCSSLALLCSICSSEPWVTCTLRLVWVTTWGEGLPEVFST